MPITPDRPLAIYFEHPDWFRPLFHELDRRAIPYTRLHADAHSYEPVVRSSSNEPPMRPSSNALVFNRMSPSAYQRGCGHAIFYTLGYLADLERAGVRVVNGHEAFRLEISKARQLSLLTDLGLPHPPARVIHRPENAPAAADGLRFPVVIKPNIGGSGAGIRRFGSVDELRHAAASGDLDLGLDHTALVQEFIPAEGQRIVRVEVLGGRYLYAIRIYTPGGTFNLCPADVCQTTNGAPLERTACPADAADSGMRVEGYTPPDEIIGHVERIMKAARIEVGGVEYMIDARDGRPVFYDINALSNFVADAPRVVGFDPFEKLVDYLVQEAT